MICLQLRSRPKKHCTRGVQSTCRSSSAREEEWLGGGQGGETSDEIKRLNLRIKELEDEVAELKRDKNALQGIMILSICHCLKLLWNLYWFRWYSFTELVFGCDLVRECKILYNRMRKDVRHSSPTTGEPDKQSIRKRPDSAVENSSVQPSEPVGITAVDAPVVEPLELVDKTTGIQHETDQLKHKDMSVDVSR